MSSSLHSCVELVVYVITTRLSEDPGAAVDLSELIRVMEMLNAGSLRMIQESIRASRGIKETRKYDIEDIWSMWSNWNNVCTALERLSSAGQLEIFSEPCIKVARSHNYYGCLAKISGVPRRKALLLVKEYNVGVSAKDDSIVKSGSMVAEHISEIEHWISSVESSEDVAVVVASDHYRRVQETLRMAREARTILSNFSAYLDTGVGVLLQITVRRLVAKSSLRRFPRDLIRNLAEFLV